MNLTDTLRHEHDIVLLVVNAARCEGDTILHSSAVNRIQIEKMVDFFANFVDRCHHTKEERMLFPKMEQCGCPVEGGPIAVMLEEHEGGRGRLRAIAEALPQAAGGAPEARTVLAENLKEYADLLENHIAKENNVLYPMADRLLSAEDQQAIAAAAEQFEADEIGKDTHEKYHHIAHEIGRD